MSDNAILISATWLLTADNEAHPIRWDQVAILADLCEEDAPPCTVTANETKAMLRQALKRGR